MIKLIHQDTFEGVTKFVEVEINQNKQVCWHDHLSVFLEFLNSAGYIIDQTVIEEMAQAAIDVHDKYLDQKFSKETPISDNDGWLPNPNNTEEDIAPEHLYRHTLVEVKLRNGAFGEFCGVRSAEISDWDWSITNHEGDIMEYRVVK